MAYPHHRSQFGDTTYTKVFVGGLAWETPTEEMRRYFEGFGDILEAVIITDKNTGKSKGYGFVTFRDPESARRACADPNPVIDGRRANCNIASLGRPRPSPPRGRIQGGGINPYHGSAGQSPTSYSGVPAPLAPPPPPPPPSVIYPPYGYTSYTPDHYGYHQALYSPQYYHQMYGASTSTMGSPAYYYGNYLQASPRGGGTFPTVTQPSQQRMTAATSYLYYQPAQIDPSASFPTTYPPPPQLRLPVDQRFPSSTDSQTPAQHTATDTEDGGDDSESPNQ